MGFPFPHYDAEFLLGVTGIALLTAVLFPIVARVPNQIGADLMAIPLVLLIGWCAWTWYRVRRG
jgi:hypothetical protein